MDSTYDPSDWRLHANLGTHESEGHGFGFNHTRGGIMNASIVLVDPLTWKGDPSWNVAARYYGGEPIDDPETPPPPPPPPPGPSVPVSSFKLDGKDYDIYLKGGKSPPIVIEV
jgi:hypothetical protein